MDAETEVCGKQDITESDGDDVLDKLVRKAVTVSQVNLPMETINKDIDDIAKSYADENERQDNVLDGQFVRLLERTRQRRELLDQKMGKAPEAAPRKRRSPLTEDLTHNVKEGSAQSEDSPKRQCVRGIEEAIKPDTPAIASVKSRLQNLATQRAFWSEGGPDDTEEYIPQPVTRKSVLSPPKDTVKAAGQDENMQPTSQRKSRFAQLASNISSWEDDLSHPNIIKEEEKKPRWQPPKATEPSVTASRSSPKKSQATASSVTKECTNRSPLKSCGKVDLTSKPEATKALESQKDLSPSQKADTLMESCPVKEIESQEESTHSGDTDMEKEKDLVQEEEVQKRTQVQKETKGSDTKEPSLTKPENTKGPETPKPQVIIPSSERPLSARLANWEQKISESKPDMSATPKSGFANSTKVNATPKVCTPARPMSTPGLEDCDIVQMRPKARRTADDEPTAHPVSARMSAWEQMSSAQAVSSVKKVKPGESTPMKTPTAKKSPVKLSAAATPGKTPAQDSVKELAAQITAAHTQNSATPTKTLGQSPKKVGSAMKLAQQQLAQQTQRTDMAERLRQERMAELQSIQNRFKNGILKDDNGGRSQEPSKAESASKSDRRQGQREKTRADEEESMETEPTDIKSTEGMETTSGEDKTIIEHSNIHNEKCLHGHLAEDGLGDDAVEKNNTKQTPVIISQDQPESKNVQEESYDKVTVDQDITGQEHEVSKSADTQCIPALVVDKQQVPLITEGTMKEEKSMVPERQEETPGAATENGHPGEKSDQVSEPACQTEGQDQLNTPQENSQADKFESKLASIGLDGQDAGQAKSSQRDTSQPESSSSTAGECRPKSLPPASFRTEVTGKPPRPTSLYSIVSQQKSENASSTPKPATTSESSNKASRRVQFEDSFDSEESHTPQSKELPTQKGMDTNPPTQMEDDADCEVVLRRPRRGAGGQQPRPKPSEEDDDLSLSAFVPESVRRESVLPSSQGQSGSDLDSSINSVDSFEGAPGAPPDFHKSTVDLVKLGQQYADTDSCSSLNTQDITSASHLPQSQPPTDNGSQDMEESVDDRDAIGDLLDEAMDTDGEEPSTSAKPPVPVMRKKAQRKATEAGNLPFSINEYRASRNMQIQEVKQVIVRNSQYAGLDIKEEDVQMPTSAPVPAPRRSVQDKIKELQELVQQEQSIIMQTSNAINQCCSSSSYFAGSSEQVECNRILLLSCQKRQAYLTEIQRLRDNKSADQTGPGPTGSLTISDIRLPLKKEFVTKIGTSQDTMTFYFILLLKNGPQVICTQMLSTHDPMMRGSLDFPNLIKINGITGSFQLQLEIYCMSVSRESCSKDKKKKTPKKMKTSALTVQSPGGPLAVRTTSFSQVTTVQLTMKSLDKHCFSLDRLPHLSPLHGMIYLNLKCLMEASIEEKGFLTMFEDVSGLGSWHRRWCVLSGNKLQYWKYPDDETRKDPMGYVDLKRCVTEKVGLISRDICARPHTFELCTVRQPQKGEKDTLVSRTYSTMTTVRHMLSADTKEERIVWCNKINRALANIRTWHPDAMRPIAK